MAVKIFRLNDEPEKPDVYLTLDTEGGEVGEVSVDVVTAKGAWIRTLLTFTETEGVLLHTGANDAGFPTDKQGRIKVRKL